MSEGREERVREADGARTAPWYERAFRSSYLDLYAHRSESEAAEEIHSLLSVLHLAPPSRILDLCCGSGRHAMALRREGHRVLGLDLSLELLRPARRAGLDVARGDMRRLPFAASRFDAVFELFTSFGYFEREDENVAVLREVARLLVPSGRHVLDLMNAQRVLRALVPRSEHVRDGETWIQERTHDARRHRIEKRIVHVDAQGRTESWTESVALYEPDEIARLLAGAGLRVEACFGGFDGRPFDARSDRMLLVSRA